MGQAMINVTGELRNWKYNEEGNFFTGFIYGDKKERWPDNRWIMTSSVQVIYHYDLLDIAVTHYSVYLLYHNQEEGYDGFRGQVPSEKRETRF